MITNLESRVEAGEVLPCPICGSKRIYAPQPKYDFMYCQKIACADCGLRGFKNFTKDINPDEAIEKVIKYWNNRQG